MEFIGFFLSCLLIIMGLLGLFGMITGEYPILKLWTGGPGRIASLFIFLPVLISLLASIFGWLGPNRDSPAYSMMNVFALVGCVVFSLLAGWIVEKIPTPDGNQQKAGYSCAWCGQELLTNDQLIYEQILLVQVGQADAARKLVQRTGYQCISCGRRYCKHCLEIRAFPKASGGRACPYCGGDFRYMESSNGNI